MTQESLRLDNISKKFLLQTAKPSWTSRIFGNKTREGAYRKFFWALRNIDLTAFPGDSVGVIGPNGAGKSTLVKILAGILHSDEGAYEVRGRLSALLEVGAGFHPDLTGRENVFLQGVILGMDRRTIARKFDDIVEFAGLERFIDMPVKRYSSGMFARLGFSVAAHVEPDVLIVDEALSVGDALFRHRCLERMASLVSNGTTLIFITHNLEQMTAICKKAVVLQEGRVAFAGPADQAAVHYLRAVSLALSSRRSDVQDERQSIRDVQLHFHDAQGDRVTSALARSDLCARLDFDLREPISRLVVELNMRTPAGERLLSFNSLRSGRTFDLGVGRHQVELHLPGIAVASGCYVWNVRMWDAAEGTTLVDTPMQFPLLVDDGGAATGLFVVDHDWRIASDENPSSTSDRSTRNVEAGAA